MNTTVKRCRGVCLYVHVNQKVIHEENSEEINTKLKTCLYTVDGEYEPNLQLKLCF